ncbi:MAG TPA: hypothetical protein VFO16_15870 [Pseudonocardiaceae bacterium]|nr:hypothetical protein [Pseudonocardiaceae bacterium]
MTQNLRMIAAAMVLAVLVAGCQSLGTNSGGALAQPSAPGVEGGSPGDGGVAGEDNPGDEGSGGESYIDASIPLPPSTGHVPPKPGGVLPENRITTWNPGVTYGGGGIRRRDKTCAELTPSGGDDTAQIQRAIDQCPDDQVVLLGKGTFEINGEGLTIARSRITLRGVGSGVPGTGEGGTRLVKADGESNRTYAVLYVQAPGPDLRADDYPAPSIDLAVDGVKGENAVRLVDASALEVGEYVLLDHVTNGDPNVVWNYNHEGPGEGTRRWFARQDRSLSQIMKITAIDGDTVSFETPLHTTFKTAYDAQLTRFVDESGRPSFLEWVGIEGVFFEGGMGGDYHGNVAMGRCGYCWIAGIESNRSLGTAVGLYSTYRSELRDSYIHSTVDPNPGGGGYLTGINFGASDNLIENNIMWQGNKMIVARASGGGNVIAYNYMQDGYGDGYKNIPEIGLNAGHYTTPHMELLEGNEAFNFGGDSGWGNSIQITAFRNHITGTRRDAGHLGLTDEVLRRVVGLDRYQYDYNFVANVLGEPDMTPVGNQYFVDEITASNYLDFAAEQRDPVPMWLLGYDQNAPEGEQFDPRVAETTIRHGNFDYLTKRVSWDNDLPKDLPPSLYLTEKPAFFGDLPWPWVTPEADGERVATLPARARFDAMPTH